MKQEDTFQNERQIANEIMETVHRLQLPFKLDQLTEGRGNCFPISIIQQCKRPEIHSQLRTIPKRLVKDKTGYSTLRHHVRQFISKSKHPNVGRLKAYYEETDALANRETWEDYWKRMTKNQIWVDSWFKPLHGTYN